MEFHVALMTMPPRRPGNMSTLAILNVGSPVAELCQVIVCISMSPAMGVLGPAGASGPASFSAESCPRASVDATLLVFDPSRTEASSPGIGPLLVGDEEQPPANIQASGRERER